MRARLQPRGWEFRRIPRPARRLPLAQDLVRVPLEGQELSPPVDQFTIALDPRDGGGLLRLSWAEASCVVPLGTPAR